LAQVLAQGLSRNFQVQSHNAYHFIMANTTDGKVQIAGAGTSPDANKKLYDDWAKNYAQDVRTWGYTMPEDCAKILLKHCRSQTLSTYKVLDAGGGDGLSGKAITDLGFKDVTGTDLSPELIEIAKKDGIYKEAEVMDLSKPMKYANNHFDAITVVGVMTYLEPDGCSLDEFCRVVKPGGLVIMTHRTDKVAKWKSRHEQLISDGKWEVVEITDPLPYLPNNPEYGEKVKVIIHVYRVRVPKPWGKPASGHTFNPKYPTEFRLSAVPDGGMGWWAKVDIPKGIRMRRVSVAEGSLVKVGSLKELEETGWGMDESVNYGIGHRKDTSAIYFLNPGTACNHADPTRERSIVYKHDEQDVYEQWTTKDIKAGEEMFIDYGESFAHCKWFLDFHNTGNPPRYALSQLGPMIDDEVKKGKAATLGASQSLQKSKL